MQTKTIAVLAGDGVGPEVMREAVRVASAVVERAGRSVRFVEGLVGGAAFDEYGEHMPAATIDLCRGSDAILFGSVGGPIDQASLPKWRGCEANSILALRKCFNLAANIRPARVYSHLLAGCPLKDSIIRGGIDLVIIRELLGDVYFGEKTTWTEDGKRYAQDVGAYSEDQIAVAARVAFETARRRRGKVTSVDKANVMQTSKLWREVVREVHKNYTDVKLEDMLVDNCALQLVKNPAQFDVIVTSNLFGDILSDLAAALPGSLGLTPSASLNANGFGLYEPSGGSAPDIAGKGIANPIAQILSAAMMFRFSFDWKEEADALERAVDRALQDGYRTADIFLGEGHKVSTSEMADQILRRLA
jgi:3-isopropylmalate dehydrogenase